MKGLDTRKTYLLRPVFLCILGVLVCSAIPLHALTPPLPGNFEVTVTGNQFGVSEGDMIYSADQGNAEGYWMETMDEYLYSSCSTSFSAYGDGVHELSLWDNQYDNVGSYTGLWSPDSQDGIDTLLLLSEEFVGDLWYLDIQGSDDRVIAEVQVFDHTAQEGAVPEPGTFLLLGVGVGALIALNRKRFKRRG